MGKSLIIKGVDFSENGIPVTNYLIRYEDNDFSNCNMITNPGISTPYLFADQLFIVQSTVIKGIRIRPANSGIIPIYVADFSDDSGSYVMSNYTFKENLNVTTEMIGQIVNIFFTNYISLQENQKIVFGNKDEITMTAKWYYGYNNPNFPFLCLSLDAGKSFSISSAPLYVDYII